MFKKSLLATVITISSFAQTPKDINQSESLNIKMLIEKSIDKFETNQDINTAGWSIIDRKKRNTGESFIAILNESSVDTNLTQENNRTNNDENITGLSIYNDINYTENSFNAISTLNSFPHDSDINKSDYLLLEEIIDNKTFLINSNYSTIDYRYQVSFKDINLSIPDKVKLVTKNIKVDGYYDQNNLIKQESRFTVDAINIMPLAADILGEYFKIENFKVFSETVTNGENLNLNYTISMDLLDSFIDKEHAKMEKSNLSITVGNLNLKAYKVLVEFLQVNTENLEKNAEELQMLALELFARSTDIYIEISDLSIHKVAIKNEEMGPVKINAKISLKGTKELIQMIMVNPAFALSALTMDAKIELDKDILKEIYKEDKKAGSLAFLFAKYENESVIYEATYQEGKLIINDQLFTQNSLQNLDIEKYAPQTESIPNKQHEKKKVVDSNTTKEQTVKVNPEHVKKYEQNSLHQAVLAKDFEEVKKILQDTSTINLSDKLGRTPLHYAAFNGDIEIAKLLLGKGANIDATDRSKQWTPLFFAIFMKHEDMVNLLINEGADQTLKDKFSRTADTYRTDK